MTMKIGLLQQLLPELIKSIFGVFKIWYSILELAGCAVQLSEKEDTFTDMVIFIMVYFLP